MSAKPITLNVLRKWDDRHNGSIVRELEMTVEEFAPGALALQYWRDVALYGVRAATAWLRKQEYAPLTDTQKLRLHNSVEEILERLE